MLSDELDVINAQILILKRQRDDLLRELRKQCKHIRLVELDDCPPKRICADCGAEERGWYCDYHVLVMNGDTNNAPHKMERVLIRRTADSSVFHGYRKDGSLYPVGQSHPNFGAGVQTYEQLTELAAA
jgi:hypothetical protein